MSSSSPPEYPKTTINKVNRLPNRGHYDHTTIHTLLDRCPILHISFHDPAQPFPVVLPMLDCTANYTDPSATTKDIYLHGHISSRLFQNASSPSSTPGTTTTTTITTAAAADDDAATQGLPVTVAASFLDGLVLSLTPFHNSCNYRAAVAYGFAQRVRDDAEALWAMRCITQNMLPGRWEASRVPPTRAEVASTGVLRVRISSASAKIRTGGPSEDRADLRNEELVRKTWTGVVPYWGTWGEPVPGEENGCEDVEEYIESWRVGENGRVKREAFEAAAEK